MGCPLNKKKWWIFEWEGSHNFEITHVGYWGFDTKFEFISTCKACGHAEKEIGVTGETMARMGIDPNKLRYERWGGRPEDFKLKTENSP